MPTPKKQDDLTKKYLKATFGKWTEEPKGVTYGFEYYVSVKFLNNLLNSLIAHYSIAPLRSHKENQTIEFNNHCKARIKELNEVHTNHPLWKDINAIKSSIAKYSTLLKNVQSIDTTRNN